MTQPLRVAIDATPLLGPLTGIGVFTKELITHLPSNNVTPVLYATSWRGRHRLAQQSPNHAEIVRRPQAARPLRSLWSRFNWPPIEWWTGPISVAHGPNFVVPPTRYAAAVMSVHDLTFMHYPEMSHRDTLTYPRFIRSQVERGSWIHTDSTFVADEISEYFKIERDRIATIPLGVTPLGPAEPQKGHQLAGGDRYIVAIGTIEPRKDLPLLVDAFDSLAETDRDLRLVIAGPDGWGQEALNERIARSSHHNRIRRLGWVSDNERAALIRGAKILAYPSRYEGFGLPPLEAMSAGIPVVATNVGSLPEVLGHNALLVPPADADRLAEALNKVLTDTNLADDLAKKGPSHTAKYKWDACAAKFAQLYNQIATSNSRL